MNKDTVKKYFAMSWQHGQVHVTTNGKRYGVTYYRFESARDRAAWCAGGGSLIFSNDYREEVFADDPGLRYELNSKFGEVVSQ